MVLSIAILIRPTNLLFLSVFAFLDVRSWKEVWERIVFFTKPQYVLSFLVLLIIVFIPQMLYWRYLSGSFLYNSYPGEGFTNLAHPMVLALWFAPLNGFFLYTPLALFFIGGIVMMIVKKMPNGIFIGMLFLILSYLFASWLTWFFGGSLGMRPFIEYYPLFALPFGYFLEWIMKRRNLLIQSLFFTVIALFSWYSLKLSYNYNFFPGSIWSWDDYKIYLSDAGIQRFDRNTYSYINDFENNTLPDDVPRVMQPVHSRTLSTFLDENMEFGCKYSKRFGQIIEKNPSEAAVSLFVFRDQPVPSGALFVCSIEDSTGKLLYYKSFTFEDGINRGIEGKRGRVEEGLRGKGEEWKKVSGVFHFPEWIPSYSTVSFYIWNLQRSKFHVDDLVIKFK